MKRKVLLVLGVGGAFACGATDGWAASGAWSTPTALVSSLAQAGDYAVGMSARGEAVAAWTDNAGVFASVAEPGQGFDPPQRLARLVSPIPGRLLAVDGRGDALVVWTVANATRTSGLYASYRPAGGSFGAPQRISPNGVGADFGLDARGDATFVWMRWRSNGRPTTIDVVQRMASGALGGAQALETGVGEGDISISVDNRDDAVASWVSGSVAHATVRCALRRHGRKFGRAFPLSAPSGATNTAAGIDDTGRALVAWDAPYTGASVGFPYRDVDAATIRVGARRASVCNG